MVARAGLELVNYRDPLFDDDVALKVQANVNRFSSFIAFPRHTPLSSFFKPVTSL